jgi:hypothetical protein
MKSREKVGDSCWIQDGNEYSLGDEGSKSSLLKIDFFSPCIAIPKLFLGEHDGMALG